VASEFETTAMRRALAAAAAQGSPRGPNPRVGCVLLSAAGRELAVGAHRGAGTPHAEVDALSQVNDARGATAVVTLEPCNHSGRTGPCAEALIAAGVARVVFGQLDPNPQAAGGGARLTSAGVEVESGLLAAESEALNPYWTASVTRGRPFVTWKFAASLDGRSAAADGTSRWITSEAARADVHRLRAQVDAIAVGTGTVLADDPSLTARRADGSQVPTQPLRVVVGTRPIPQQAKVLAGVGPTAVYPTRDLFEVLADLHVREVRHLLLEGGPTLAGAFLAAGLVDEVVAYLAPVLLGAGPTALLGGGITTIADALRLQTVDVTAFGPDLRITARPLAPHRTTWEV